MDHKAFLQLFSLQQFNHIPIIFISDKINSIINSFKTEQI